MTLNEYQKLTQRTAPQDYTLDQEVVCYGMGISGEAGEVTDYLKKVVFHGHEMDSDILAKELGDVLWYAARLANSAGLTLEDVARRNIHKLQERYPDGFDRERSVNRQQTGY